MNSRPLLVVNQLQASYGRSQALADISFQIAEGECVTLLGRNGMGKSTTVQCLMGLVKPTAGQITFDGQSLIGQPAHVIARQGIGLVPEGRHIFPNLTVQENLVATAHNRQGQTDPWTLDSIYDLFPRLQERSRHLGSHLSGGEQQMLAIGRALMTNPRLLILDEATEGLAPLIRTEIWHCLATLRTRGLTILCIDKHLKALLPLADRHVILEKGRVVWSGTSSELQEQQAQLHAYLGV